MKRVCPITKGNECSMTRRAFTIMCMSWQGKISEVGENSRYQYEYVRYRCLACKGKNIPKELHFIELPENQATQEIQQEGTQMGSVSILGVCDDCKAEKKVFNHAGKKVCHRCIGVRSAIKNYPDLVLRVFNEIAPEKLQPALVVSAKEKDGEVDRIAKKLEKEQQVVSTLVGEVERLQKVIEESEEKIAEMKVDRFAVQNLALRLALGLVDGEEMQYTVSDVKMLEGI